jgi:hypothetical protein
LDEVVEEMEASPKFSAIAKQRESTRTIEDLLSGGDSWRSRLGKKSWGAEDEPRKT